MCFDLTDAPVATAARAAATGLVSMPTRPDLEGSGPVEIATRRCPRLRVVWEKLTTAVSGETGIGYRHVHHVHVTTINNMNESSKKRLHAFRGSKDGSMRGTSGLR